MSSVDTYAINPERIYSNTPAKMQLEHEVLHIETKDGLSLNVWHLPSSGPGTPIIISQSDAGNMSDWLYLGLYLQAYGLDVWMYDYRGFGESADFPIVQNQLFHMEFIDDLAAVCDHVYSKTGLAPALMGISMGTIIVNEYLRIADIPVSKVIFDGYVVDPKAWNEKLADNGKIVTLPESYKNRTYKQKNHDALFIVSEKDAYSSNSDIPKASKGKQVIKTFDCEHISGFFKYPVEYTETIVSFLEQKVGIYNYNPRHPVGDSLYI